VLAVKSRVASVLVLVFALAGCSRWAKTPRFGSLVEEGRRFEFKHGIELLHAKNGMTFALLRDDRTNLVTVDVRYQVGAAEDPPGRAGMAHLVEHLLFTARVAADGPTIGDLLGEKALYYNAGTTADMTQYTSVALAHDLTAVLALEAKRLAVTCKQIPDALFLRERDVVLQEELQRHGVYDTARAEILEAVWGKGHPYAHAPGSREIGDATRDEVCAFIEKQYVPARAILAVTGKIDVDVTASVLAKLFGPLSAHETGPRMAVDAPELEGGTSQHVADIDDAGAMIFFPAPAWGSPDVARWSVVIAYLEHELDDLEKEHDWIHDVSISSSGGYRARATTVWLSVSDPARLDQAVKLVFEKVAALRDRVDWTAAPRLIAYTRTQLMRQWDDFLSRPSWIIDYLQYTRDNRFFLRELEDLDALTANDLQGWARRYLTRANSHVALVRPSGKEPHDDRIVLAAPDRGYDVQLWRQPVDAADATRPLDQHGTTRVATPLDEVVLDNGVRVLLAPDPGNPIVEARVVFPVGSAADPADRPGLAMMAAELLGHDFDAHYDRSVADKLLWVMGLGTQMTDGVDEVSTTFTARGLSVFADWHVWQLFWLLDQGIYARDDVAAFHQRAKALDDDDEDVRDQVLRTRLFGDGHPYAAPGITSAQAARIDGRALDGFRRQWYAARGATVIVVGGFDVDQMRKEIRELFGAWSDAAPPAAPKVPGTHPAKGPSWIAVRNPDEAQPHVTIAFATGSDPQRDRAARAVLQAMLEDRLRVVREGMAASYGIDVGYASGAGGGELYVDGYVDPGKLAKVVKALLAELTAVRDGAATAAEDFVRARRRVFAQQLADAAGADDLALELDFIASHRLPLGYFDQTAAAIAAVTPGDVAAVAATDLAERRMVVVLSGRAPVVTGAFEVLGVKPELLDAR